MEGTVWNRKTMVSQDLSTSPWESRECSQRTSVGGQRADEDPIWYQCGALSLKKDICSEFCQISFPSGERSTGQKQGVLVARQHR